MCNDYPIIINNNINNMNFNTGDMISVSYSHCFGSFVSAWSASVVSHPGIIYKKDDGSIYIVEAAFYNKEYRHVVMVPLVKWLKFNKRHEIFYSKYSGPKISDNKMEQTFEKFKKYKLEKFNVGWIRLLKKTEYIELNKPRYVCYEITIGMLQDLGIVKKKYAVNSYWPKHITYGELDYEDGIKYSSPLYIKDKNFFITAKNQI